MFISLTKAHWNS